ncbi:serine/threonine protein kinase [Nocardiopsis valliformis]|uniref:serine/threonine protein kinase n=1 Tax=Nocardiopsis valliformis TaxID=239974 RepID=UPI0003478756|nr:hypothetical protein [Nocardiopsis valliformis]
MSAETSARFDRDFLPPGVAPPAKGDPDRLGAYRIVGRITRDAAGTVLLGVDGDGVPAAVRLIPAALADVPDVRSRMAAEVGRLVRVRALCTAAYRGADVRAAQPWLATAYVPGRTLAAHVAEHGPLTGGMLTALAAGLAESLAAGHSAGATHLALDPTKVILAPEGPKVVGLGVARATGKPISAPRWAAPEQGSPEGAPATGITGYADVYAWGALVRFAATGWEPSGDTATEPELGAVPAHLAPLVRRALVAEPGERPTALELLQELTAGEGEDPPEAVSALLSAEWTGITAPEPQRVHRVRRPAALAGTAAVLVVALLGGWALARPGAGDDPADTAAAGNSMQEDAAEEPSGPTVAEDPEDIDAVVTEAIDLALEASSFTTYEQFISNSPGDFMPTRYLYSEDPRPAMSRTMYLGPHGQGVLALGPELNEFVYFTDRPTETFTGSVKEYFLDPGPGTDRLREPRKEWEEMLLTMEVVLAEDAQVSYEGQGTFDDEYIPRELMGDEDALERGGHHYTGTLAHVFPVHLFSEPVAAEFELWISSEGHPVRLSLEAVPGGITDGGEALRIAHRMDYFQFDQHVDVGIPDESEIHPERP